MFGPIGDFYSKTLTGQTDPNRRTGNINQSRGMQREGLGTVGDWAFTGTGPSQAQGLVQRNRAEGAAQQVGMAKTMGGDPALANRNAAEGIARGNAEASFQGAQLRAQEQQQAMSNYLQGVQAMREQDQGLYNTQIGVDQQNAANRQSFWGNAINTGASAIGGFF